MSTTTIERLILETLGEGEHEYEDLVDELDLIYKPTGETFRLRDFESSLDSLIQKKLIAVREGHWEFQYFYRLTKKVAQKYAPGQKKMFGSSPQEL